MIKQLQTEWVSNFLHNLPLARGPGVKEHGEDDGETIDEVDADGDSPLPEVDGWLVSKAASRANLRRRIWNHIKLIGFF